MGRSTRALLTVPVLALSLAAATPPGTFRVPAGEGAAVVGVPPGTSGAQVLPKLPPLLPAVPELIKSAEKKPVPAKYDVNRIGERDIGAGLDFYSLEREIEMGREMAAEVERSSRLVQDPVVNEYINRVAQNLVRNSDARVPFTVKVVDSDEINAYALPGGFFYINTGLILAADSEAELAGVMAHEIAHVAARHATKNATKVQLLNLLSIPMIFFGGPAGYAVRQVMGFAVPMSMLKFSRDAEREADALGLEYAYAAGYDPEEFIRFFEKLRAEDKNKKKSFLAKAFETHPMNGERVERAQKEIETYFPAREEHVVDTSEFEDVKARLEKINNRGLIDEGQGFHPVLRRRTPQETTKPSGGGGEPPTLKRR